MKKKGRWSLFLLWGLILYILYQKGYLPFDINTIQAFIEEYPSYAMLLFVLLFSVRSILFFPSLPFMIMGGVLFGGIKGFFLSMLGLSVSLSLIYGMTKLVSGSKLKEKLKKKNNKLMPMLERYNEKFLAVGILAPIANTDVVCILTIWATDISYIKYLLTITLVNVPTVFVYSMLGNTYNESLKGMIFFGIFMAINLLVSITILIKMKKDIKNFNRRKGLNDESI